MRKIVRTFLLITVLSLAFYQHFTLGTRRTVAILLQILPFSSKWLGPPKGFSYAKEQSKNSAEYIPIFPSHVVQYSNFPLQEVSDSATIFPEAFVLKVSKGRVYGSNGLVILPNDRILADTAIEWVSSIKKHPIFRKHMLPKLHFSKEKIAVIASKSGDCYFHWMFDILPKLELLKRSNLSYDKIYLNPLKYPFQKESFAQLNLDPQKVIWAAKKQHIECEELIVPSMPSGTGLVSDWVCDFLREQFLHNKPETQTKKLYISRKEATSRRILNEKELFLALEKLGFQEVILEKLTINEQAELFASAECIVAPHGAGLTNLVFCDHGTKIIEIFSPHYINPCYFRLCEQKGLPYHALIGSSETRSSECQSKNDIIVSIPSVLENI